MWMYSFLVILGYLNLSWSQNSADCSPNEEVPCMKYVFKGTNCSESAQRKRFAYMPFITNTLNIPGKPDNTNVSARYKLHSNGDHYVQVNLTFTPPANGGILFLKGFEITRYIPGVDPSCTILDLSNVTWDFGNIQTAFELSLFPLPAFVYFEVYSLPKYENRSGALDQYVTVKVDMPQYTDTSQTNAADWVAEIYFDLLQAEGVIEVSINSPPSRFGFTSYDFNLLYSDNRPAFERKTVNQMNYKFINVSTGEYYITVKPYDPFYTAQDASKCLCTQIDTVAVCVPCTTTKTKTFNFTYTGSPCSNALVSVPLYCYSTTLKSTMTTSKLISMEDPNPETTRSVTTRQLETTVALLQKSDTDMKIVVSVVGAFLGIVVAGIVFFVLLTQCKKKEKEKADTKKKQLAQPVTPPPAETNDGYEYVEEDDGMSVLTCQNLNNQNKGGLIHFEKQPKLVLLYEDENEYHRRVVTTFGTYLQTYCQCSVMTAEFALDAPWVHQDLEKADFAVIVNSEGAFRAYESKFGETKMGHFDRSPPGSRRMSSINSLRNKFKHEERYDNIVMVYFEYTDEQFIIPDICPGFKFKLMKHFSDFLLHVHKLHRADKNLALYDLPLDGNLQHRPIGQKLADAIAEAIQYEQNKPQKAKLRGLDPSSWERQNSDDSRYDSGLQSAIGTPGVSSINGNEFWRIRPELLAILADQSCDAITINPSDIGIHLENTGVHEKLFVSKPRPHLNIPKNPGQCPSHFESQGSGDSGQDEFNFIAPDDFDAFDVASHTLSDQMQHIVDAYEQNSVHSAVPHSVQTISPGPMNNLSKPTRLGYDRSIDLQTQFENDDVISLGGVSV